MVKDYNSSIRGLRKNVNRAWAEEPQYSELFCSLAYISWQNSGLLQQKEKKMSLDRDTIRVEVDERTPLIPDSVTGQFTVRFQTTYHWPS